MSTRKVAAEAGVPLSQVHYHFGSKGGLILALLEEENKRRLDRQTRMYAEDRPLWQRYEQACDFLEDDLDSGYVRVLQEMIAAGWSNDQIGKAVHDLLAGWFALLIEVAREAERRHGPLGAAADRCRHQAARGRAGTTGEGERCGPANRSLTATSSARASRSTTRCSAPVSRRWCSCPPGRSSTRATGSSRSRTWLGATGWSPSTAVATAAPTG